MCLGFTNLVQGSEFVPEIAIQVFDQHWQGKVTSWLNEMGCVGGL